MSAAHLSFLLFTLVFWALVLVVNSITRRFGPKEWQRLVFGAFVVVMAVVALALQLLTYDALSIVILPFSDDAFLYWGLLIECLAGIGLLIVGAARVDRDTRRHGPAR